MNGAQRKRGGRSSWYLMLLIPFVAVLWPPLYNRAEPVWIGLPFFYWYQLACVLLSALITAVVYWATRD